MSKAKEGQKAENRWNMEEKLDQNKNNLCHPDLQNRIVFMGTPQIAADVLQALLDAGANIVLAVTQPDKKTGRKQILRPCEVKSLALENGIEVFQPAKIRQDCQKILDAKPDLIVTCAYGQIVPKEVLEAPRTTCVNLHGSLLPEYRGAAPIQRAIWDGKTKSGMALMEMEEGMDTGGVLAVKELEITPEDTSSTMFSRMGKAAGELIVEQLENLLSGQANFIAQDHDKATYAKKIERSEEKIDLSQSDQNIFNQIRALSAEPGAYVMAGKKKLKLLETAYILSEQEELQPGLLEMKGKKGMLLHLHHGKLDLFRVQMEGKPAMNIADFMNGQGRSLAGKKVS